MKSTHFIVGHLWKLEIRHKSNLKKQQIIALIGIHRETFMKIERHKLELFEKKIIIYMKFMKIIFILKIQTL